MKQIQMTANIRNVLKKNAMHRLRNENLIPGVIYGKGEKTVNLQVKAKELRQAIHTPAGTNVLVKLNIEGEEQPQEETVMIKALQRHPVTSKLLHVDFVKISMDKPLETAIPVLVTGTARGIKEGGMLEQVHRELNIRCLPALLPENIKLDAAALGIGDSITVGDLQLAEGVEVLVASHEPVVHVVAPRVEETKPAEGEEVAAVPEATQQPEVVGEKEREQRRVEKEKSKS